MSDREWNRLDNETRHGFWYVAKWFVAVVLLIGMIGIGIWGFKVASSDAKGQGDAVRTKNAAGNRIAQQEGFQQLYNDIKAADQRIDVLAEARRADPNDHTAKVNYTGAVTYCIGLVGDYNAKGEKFTAEDFRDAELPKSIDRTKPDTDCKETQK